MMCGYLIRNLQLTVFQIQNILQLHHQLLLYLPNFHPNKDKVQISYYLVLVSPASKQFWGELRKRFFFSFATLNHYCGAGSENHKM